MAVTSRPMKDTASPRDDIRRAISTEPPRAPVRQVSPGRKPFQVDRIQAENRQILQVLAWVVLAASFLGAVFTFNGGVTAFNIKEPLSLNLANPRLLGLNLYLVAVGLLLQFVVTRIEWQNAHNKKSLWYIGAFAVDTWTTYAAFSVPLVAVFSLILRNFSMDAGTAATVGGFIALVFCAAGAIIPEHSLVED